MEPNLKRVCATSILILVLVVLAKPALAGYQYQISDDVDINFGFAAQGLLRYTDFRNPNSNHADEGADLFLHRGLLHIGGNVGEHVRYFFQTKFTGDTENNPDVEVNDATVNLHYQEVAQLILGLQTPPSNRAVLTPDEALMAMDRPGISGYSLTWGLRSRVEFDTATIRNTNSGVNAPYPDRDLGGTFFGVYSFNPMLHVKYYAGAYEGIHKNTDASVTNLRYTGRIQMNLFDPEPGYENLGMYLGNRKTIAIGYSNDIQNDVVENVKNGNGVEYASLNQVDLFIEYPVGPGSATFEGAYLHT
jgi:hypothetical protein